MIFDKKPLVAHVAHTLLMTGVERVVVVGSELLIQALPPTSERLLFCLEGRTLVDNLLRGAETLGLSGEDRFLQCAVDLPMVSAGALCDLLEWTNADADVVVPLVPEETFRARFPDAPYRALRFAEGRFISASASVMRLEFLMRYEPLLRQLARHRKSVPSVVATLLVRFHHHLFTSGVPLAVRFLAGRLSLSDLSKVARRVLDIQLQVYSHAAPELAYDVDDEHDYHYAKSWFQSARKPHNPT